VSDNIGELPEVVVTAQRGGALTPLIVPYADRRITVTITLSSKNFAGTSSNQITLTNFRVWAQIENFSTPAGSGSAIIRISGLSLDHINQISQTGFLFKIPKPPNEVSISAGDVNGNFAQIYQGIIQEAKPDFSNQVDAAFIITALASSNLRYTPTTPISYPGGVAAGDALAAICKQAGVTLQNNGVTGQLASPYFPGTAWQQMLRAADAAGAFAFYNAQTNTLTVWPKNGASPNKSQANPVLISVPTGMIGYPEFQASYVKVRNVFSNGLQAVVPGTYIKVQSTLTAANGVLSVQSSTTTISARLPKGPWEIAVVGVRPGY
jgi:hypothetical protein